MIQPATFQEALHFIWNDQTPFEIYGTEQTKTKKQVYQDILGKKARKGYYAQYPNLRKKEINTIIETSTRSLKTALVVMHFAPLLIGDLRRANLTARERYEGVKGTKETFREEK